MKIIQIPDELVERVIHAIRFNGLKALAENIKQQCADQSQSKTMTADELWQQWESKEHDGMTDFHFQRMVIYHLNQWRDEAVLNALKAQSK